MTENLIQPLNILFKGREIGTILIEKECSWCGDKIKAKDGGFICHKNHWWAKGKYLCIKCAKKCNICKEHFCQRHINNHRCGK